MNNILSKIHIEVYEKCGFEISNFKLELESREYDACRFELTGRNIFSRTSKITPKKIGQFVTFWKRNTKGVIIPFDESDEFDYYVVNCQMENKLGQFVFPKSVLINKRIVSIDQKEGKRGFRVYPNWEIAKNKQAEKTQKWQLDYFFEINDSTDLLKVAKLYKTE